MSGEQSLVVPQLDYVKHLVIGRASIVFASACVVLLCRLLWRLLMCLFVQQDRRCRHASIGHDVHMGMLSCERWVVTGNI